MAARPTRVILDGVDRLSGAESFQPPAVFIDAAGGLIGDQASDPALLAFQAGAEFKPSKNTSLQFGATYYDFLHLDAISHDADDITDNVTKSHGIPEHGRGRSWKWKCWCNEEEGKK